MSTLLQAAKLYVQSLEGTTPHTADQEAARANLRKAIADEENVPVEQKPEGHTSEGWTDDGTGREKPKMTLEEAKRQLDEKANAQAAPEQAAKETIN